MRTFTVISTLLLTSQAQLIPFFTSDVSPSRRFHLETEMSDSNQQQQQQQQQPLNPQNPNIQLPPSSDNSKHDQDDATTSPPSSGSIILSDIIPTQRLIAIFASITREVPTVSSRLENPTLNTTVLAPVNSAINALPRKPWENPREYEALGAQAYEGSDGQARAKENLKKFAEAHIVPASPWGEGEVVETIGGGKVWWEEKGGKTLVMPGSIEVEKKVGGQVANGEVWVLKGVVNYKG